MATVELDMSPEDLYAVYDKLAEAGIPKNIMFITEQDGEPFSLELFDGKDSIEFVPRGQPVSAFVRDRIEED